jgi:hypothetical protein
VGSSWDIDTLLQASYIACRTLNIPQTQKLPLFSVILDNSRIAPKKSGFKLSQKKQGNQFSDGNGRFLSGASIRYGQSVCGFYNIAFLDMGKESFQRHSIFFVPVGISAACLRFWGMEGGHSKVSSVSLEESSTATANVETTWLADSESQRPANRNLR